MNNQERRRPRGGNGLYRMSPNIARTLKHSREEQDALNLGSDYYDFESTGGMRYKGADSLPYRQKTPKPLKSRNIE